MAKSCSELPVVCSKTIVLNVLALRPATYRSSPLPIPDFSTMLQVDNRPCLAQVGSWVKWVAGISPMLMTLRL